MKKLFLIRNRKALFHIGEKVMLNGLIEYSTQWKDFFWIIFTLVATLTSMLTYIHVRKTIRQPLYNKVIDSQIDVYSRLLELLKDSPETFIYSCNFDLLLKYNLISHCVHFGFFENQELPHEIYHAYIGPMWKEKPNEEFDLEEALENIESITLYGSMTINHGEINNESRFSSNIEQSENHDSGIGVYQLNNIRGAFLHTPSFQKFYEELLACLRNIYMPKRLKKRLDVFHQTLLDVLLKNLTTMIEREEARILTADEGEEIVIDFDSLFNELLGCCDELMKQHELVRKEIRKLLKIDARW